ncbi:MAG: VCBS repeat-containing protein [Pleurocapsa sp. SU_196_0]|nr:VCBS repeat-containing protein [Pleurocapsa sp. SU_196_0]
MRLFAVLWLLCCAEHAVAVEARITTDLQRELPTRHAVMRVYTGDINGDGRPDVVLLARSWDEANNPDTPRPLLLLLRDQRGRLQRVTRADQVLRCRACGGVAGDPWARRDQYRAKVVIAPGRLTVLEFVGSGWRGWRITTFVWRGSRLWVAECRGKTWHTSHQFAPVFTRFKPRPVPIEVFNHRQHCP